jgi:hypothetical protein
MMSLILRNKKDRVGKTINISFLVFEAKTAQQKSNPMTCLNGSHENLKLPIKPYLLFLKPFSLTCTPTMITMPRNETLRTWRQEIIHLDLFAPWKGEEISTIASKEHPLATQAMTENNYPTSRRSWHTRVDTSQVQIGNSQLEQLAVYLLPKQKLVSSPSSNLSWFGERSFQWQNPCNWKIQADPVVQRGTHQLLL